MGRGDRPTPTREVLPSVDPYEVVVADEAMGELDELVSYIRKDSLKNARAVYEAISQRLFELRTGAELLGHIDPRAPRVPAGATARITTVKKVALHYLFPMTRRGRKVLLIVGIRRGSRLPLEQPEYARRWLEEATKPERP